MTVQSNRPSTGIWLLAVALSTMAPDTRRAARGQELLREGGSGPRALPIATAADDPFLGWVRDAVKLLREQLGTKSRCRRYFDRHGVDLGGWLGPTGPPYVVARNLTQFSPRARGSVCGGIESRRPFNVIFVDKECFPDRSTRATCDLASLLLHEMGHLARRDTTDNEPQSFFRQCRLNGCVNPALFD